MKYYIGIDNGVTGSVCILDENGICLDYFHTPVQKTLNYTKVKEYITRLDSDILGKKLRAYPDATVVIERPMINPSMWKATVSAIRCDEATRSILEILKLKFIYVDSREWQIPMLPKRSAPPGKAKKGSTHAEKKALAAKRSQYKTETKTLSLATGQRLFPKVQFEKDADAALIAEWARRNNL